MPGTGPLGTCIDLDCTDGAALVNEMDKTYQGMDADTQAHFKVAHDTIMANLATLYPWYAGLIPFNTNCCAVSDLGQQAFALMNQMIASTGGAAVTQPPPPDSYGGPLSLASIAVIAVVAYLFYNKGKLL